MEQRRGGIDLGNCVCASAINGGEAVIQDVLECERGRNLRTKYCCGGSNPVFIIRYFQLVMRHYGYKCTNISNIMGIK